MPLRGLRGALGRSLALLLSHRELSTPVAAPPLAQPLLSLLLWLLGELSRGYRGSVNWALVDSHGPSLW